MIQYLFPFFLVCALIYYARKELKVDHRAFDYAYRRELSNYLCYGQTDAHYRSWCKQQTVKYL